MKKITGGRDGGEKGMNFELRFYSGYKGEETPKSVLIGKREFKIDEVVSRKRIVDRKTGRQSDVYICRMKGETVKITNFERGEWSISFDEEK
jgi:hypothetical protein